MTAAGARRARGVEQGRGMPSVPATCFQTLRSDSTVSNKAGKPVRVVNYDHTVSTDVQMVRREAVAGRQTTSRLMQVTPYVHSAVSKRLMAACSNALTATSLFEIFLMRFTVNSHG